MPLYYQDLNLWILRIRKPILLVEAGERAGNSVGRAWQVTRLPEEIRESSRIIV